MSVMVHGSVETVIDRHLACFQARGGTASHKSLGPWRLRGIRSVNNIRSPHQGGAVRVGGRSSCAPSSTGWARQGRRLAGDAAIPLGWARLG